MACFLRTTFRANILGASHPARKLAGPQRRLEIRPYFKWCSEGESHRTTAIQTHAQTLAGFEMRLESH
jgi:hypothetical protein